MISLKHNPKKTQLKKKSPFPSNLWTKNYGEHETLTKPKKSKTFNIFFIDILRNTFHPRPLENSCSRGFIHFLFKWIHSLPVRVDSFTLLSSSSPGLEYVLSTRCWSNKVTKWGLSWDPKNEGPTLYLISLNQYVYQ